MASLDGARVAAFVQQFCRHTIGEVAGKPIELRSWQREILDGLFALDERGLWRHRTGLVMLPRKSAKSQLGSGMALAALFASGEQGAQVYACAASKDQARIVFAEAKKMVEAEADLVSVSTLYKDAIEYPATGSVFRVLSSDAGLQHGLNPFFAVIDETHVHPNGELAEALSTGRGARRQSMVVHISTPAAGTNCYLHELLTRIRRAIEEGDESFYLYWNPPPEGCDYRDREVWRLAHPALGDWIDEDYLASQLHEVPESEFRRLHLAQWTKTLDAWLPHGAWDALRDPLATIEPGETVIAGVDGSWSNDSTGIVLATPDGRIKVHAAWEKPISDDSWRVPYTEIANSLREVCKTYNVRELVADPFWLANVLQVLEDEGYPVVEFATNSLARVIPACQSFYNAVMDGTLRHDGDARLARHIGNCRIKSDGRGVRITKESKGSTNKIDLAVCAVIAWDRASVYRDAPKRRYAIF